MSKLHLNVDFNPARFLQEHWQQKPVLIPQLIPQFDDLISPEELAGLACEELVESRLITQPQPGHWQLQHGPFAESVFTSLPDAHWTVLVQAVDHWVEEVADLRALFNFLPRWRIDDVMISYATEAGGVGPHFDHYDVFLLQGSGQRCWRIGDKVPVDVDLDNQDGVGILREFAARQEFILNPGDALYLPPQFAHWGHSIGASTCYSIGFRAPAMSDMLEGFSDNLIAACQPHQRYTDTSPKLPAHPANIDPDSLQAAFSSLQSVLDSPAQFARWFGTYVTQPKYADIQKSRQVPVTLKALRQALTNGKRLHHDISSRFAFVPPTSGTGLVWFVDGMVFEAHPENYNVILEICEPTILNKMDFSDIEDSNPLLPTILQLLNTGSLQLY